MEKFKNICLWTVSISKSQTIKIDISDGQSYGADLSYFKDQSWTIIPYRYEQAKDNHKVLWSQSYKHQNNYWIFYD